MKTFKQFMLEDITQQVAKAAAGQAYQKQALQQKVNPSGSQPTISRPRNITGFKTARGSEYTYTQKPKSWPQTQRTAPNDPYHPTPAGTKQKSDWTLFTTPDDSMTMRQRFVSGDKQPFYQGLRQSTQPKVGRAPVEVWKQYGEKGGRQAIHPGSPITDIKTSTPGSGVGLYGKQRQELNQRVNRALQKPQAREILNRRYNIRARKGGSSSLEDLGSPAGQKKHNPYMDYTIGTGGHYGISGIGLAN